MSSLLDVLTLDQIDENHFISRVVTPDMRGINPDYTGLYGGQMAAQSLLAACKTVSPMQVPHSLHAYFLRAGRNTVPLEITVHRDRDGRSYSSRRIEASQQGEVIFTMNASFHQLETGPDVQAVHLPTVPSAQKSVAVPVPVGIVDVTLIDATPTVGNAFPHQTWTKVDVELPDDPQIHACALTYLSDFFSGLVQFDEFPKRPRLASLDHAMWFHRPFNMNEWHLMDWQAQTMAHGRGHYIGHIYDEQGRLVASIGQEMVVRESKV